MVNDKEITQSEFVSRLISEVGTSAAKLSSTNSEKSIYVKTYKLSLVREALEIK